MTPPPLPVFHRASAPLPPSPPLPEPVLPDKESCDELDFLGNDPFEATLAKVEALYTAAVEDLSASDKIFRSRRPTLASPQSDARHGLRALVPWRAKRLHVSPKQERHLPPRQPQRGTACCKILGARFV